MVSIFHSEMAKISQVRPGMPVLILILGMNNQEEMILNALVMLSFISLKALYHGKVSLVDQKLKSMQTLRRRRKRQRLRNYVKINQKNSKSSCITVEVLLLPKIQIMDISLAYLKDA